MKLPSLIKLPKIKQFNYVPRYYDPIKENIQERIVKYKKDQSYDNPIRYKASIFQAFQRSEKKNVRASFLQLFFVGLFLGIFLAYFYLGNIVFYAFLIVAPVYIYYRKKIIKK